MSAVAVILGSSVTSGRRTRFSCRSLMAATTSGSRAHNTGIEAARRATMASAVPQAPPPMTASRFTGSRVNPRSRPRLRGGIERPTGSQRRVEAVNEAKAQPFEPSPGDHCPVVGTESWRRRNKTQPGTLGERGKVLSQSTIGGDTAGCDQGLSVRVMAAKPGNRVHGAIGQRIADREFDRGGEIGPVARIETATLGRNVTHGSLQSGK